MNGEGAVFAIDELKVVIFVSSFPPLPFIIFSYVSHDVSHFCVYFCGKLEVFSVNRGKVKTLGIVEIPRVFVGTPSGVRTLDTLIKRQ